MKWWVVLFLVVLVACTPQEVTCSAPYILHDEQCCLDKDGDGACDAKNTTSGPDEAVCELCPPKFVTDVKEVIVYKYVCMNGSIVDHEDGCERRIVSNAHMFEINKQQDEGFVEEFDTRPACRGQFRAAEVHIDPVKAPLTMTIQVKRDPSGEYEDLLSLNGTNTILDEKFVYIGLCDDPDCEGITDTTLIPDKAYLLRAVWKNDGQDVVTRDRLIDPTPDGEYSQQRC